MTAFSLRPRIGRVVFCLAALLHCVPAFAGDYFEGKMSSASESQDAESYRISGVYGMPIGNLEDTSLEMDFSFTTQNLRVDSYYNVRTNADLSIRPEAAGLYFAKSMPLWRNSLFCSDLYLRSGLVYTHDPEASSRVFGGSRWSPGVGLGMSHNFGDDTSFLMDMTHANGENRFTFGASYRFQLTRGR